MKTTLVCSGLCAALFAVPRAGAQTKDPSPPPQPLGSVLVPPIKNLHWRATHRDFNSTEWRAEEVVTNEVTGEIVRQATHRYIELGDGLSFLDTWAQDQRQTVHWRSSKEVIVPTESGSAALLGPTKVYFANNANSEASVTIVTRSNNVLRLRPLGLFWYSADTGESLPIGLIRDSQGEITPPSSVVYYSVLDHVRANLRYVWRRGSFECFLEILEALPDPPESMGNVRLEFWHSVDADERRLRRTPVVLASETNPLKRASMAEPDLVEELLQVGDGELSFPQGYAFSLGEAENTAAEEGARGGDSERVRVAKRLVRMGDKGEKLGLVESVPWEQVREQVQRLPQPARGASLRSPGVRPVKGRPLPVLEMVSVPPTRPMQVASGPYEPRGFCIDYVTVSGGGAYDFTANSTYYISSPVTFSGPVSFNQGSILKFADNAYLRLNGAVFDYGTSENPTILTSKDENIFGETISGSSGNPVLDPVSVRLVLYNSPADITLSNMRFRWAGRAISTSHSSSTSRTYTLANSAIEYCREGVYAHNCTFAFANSTKRRVDTPEINSGALVSGSLFDSGDPTLGEAVDQPGWNFSTGGNAAWFYQNGYTYYDGDAAQSGDINDNESSYLETTVTGPGTVSFWWKISSEAGYDFLRFYIDGAEQPGKISGDQDWSPASFSIGSGSHTLRWAYTKDVSVTYGSDAGYVDYVGFQPGVDPASLGEAVDNTALAWSVGGNVNWSSQTFYTHYGGDAAQSGDINDYQSSWLETAVTGPGTLSFYWKVDSETSYDYLRFSIDGIQQEAISGNVDWTLRSYSIASGTHALKWAYTKDSSLSVGVDAGWVDYVQYTAGGGGPTPPSITTQPQSQTVAQGESVTFFVGVSGSSPFGYQWALNGSPINGATNSSYYIASVQPAHGGTYTVTVTNAGGSAVSSGALLTVSAGGPLPCVAPDPTMVAWWPGDDSNTNLMGGNPAVLWNGAGYTPSGKVAQSFLFDGVYDYAEVANSAALNPTTGLTVEAWVYPTGDTYQNMALISKDGCYSDRQYFLTVSEYGRFRAHVYTTVYTLVYFDGYTNVLPNTWYHVAMTYDGSLLRLYVNGNLDRSAAAQGNLITTTQPVRIGGSTSGVWGDYKFEGRIDEPAIYNQALTATEIHDIYAAGAAGKCKPEPNLDSDGDGLPDWWENQYGLNPQNPADATADPDGDGYTNLAEYANGTNPIIANAKVSIFEPKAGANIP